MEKLHAESQEIQEEGGRGVTTHFGGGGLRFPFGNFMDYFDHGPKVLIFMMQGQEEEG